MPWNANSWDSSANRWDSWSGWRGSSWPAASGGHGSSWQGAHAAAPTQEAASSCEQKEFEGGSRQPLRPVSRKKEKDAESGKLAGTGAGRVGWPLG